MIASKHAVQYMLRLPDGLRARVAERASANGRSMNTEIIAAIEKALADGDRLTQIEARLAKLEHTFNL